MATSKSREAEFHAACRRTFENLWDEVSRLSPDTDIVPDLRDTIADMLRAPAGRSSTFRFVLPTRLLAKCVDPARDARTIQKGRDGEGASFDARSLASKVVVPFNRALGSPLGAAGDPYVNNPLRVPEISAAYRAQQKDKERWDRLSAILAKVEAAASPDLTRDVLLQTLIELRRLLEETQVRYPAPPRISLETATSLTRRFLEPRTGGRRLQAVSVALFRTLAQLWSLYDEVISAPATAADAPGDRPADIDCRMDGATVLAVEVKDQTLTLQLLEDKMASTRLAKVRELLFLVRATPLTSGEAVSDRVRREFASGQSIYGLDAEEFFEQVLALVGEAGRTVFVEMVGRTLDEIGLDYTDRRAWADLLTSV